MAKQKFKINNWPAYNKALRQRGSLTVWLDESAILQTIKFLVKRKVLIDADSIHRHVKTPVFHSQKSAIVLSSLAKNVSLPPVHC